MSNIHPFPRRDERYEQASQWVARLDRGLTDEEAKALRAWTSADTDNAAVLASMARMWDKMDALARLSDLFPVAAKRHRRLPPYALGAAASILIAVLLSIWLQFQGNDLVHPPWGESAAEVTVTFDGVYETAVGEKSTVTLSDGTLVVLNTNSLLRVAYTPGHRLLTLERGEVNVQVASDPSRPLTVAAGDQLFQAVGTAFNVEIVEGQRIELVVTEGKVRVGMRNRAPGPVSPAKPGDLLETSPSPSSRTVSAGEKFVLRPGIPEEEVTPVTPEEIEVKLSWRNGNLTFTGESLEEALEEVGRYTSVEFVFLDDELRTRTVAGLFKAGDVDGLLAALRENFDIVYERVDENTVLLDSP